MSVPLNKCLSVAIQIKATKKKKISCPGVWVVISSSFLGYSEKESTITRIFQTCMPINMTITMPISMTITMPIGICMSIGEGRT